MPDRVSNLALKSSIFHEVSDLREKIRFARDKQGETYVAPAAIDCSAHAGIPSPSAEAGGHRRGRPNARR